MAGSRRALLLAACAAPGLLACRPRRATQRLRMPFEAGVVVLCEQGTRSPAGQTHALPQNLHALDFSTSLLDEVSIVAAAPGRVVYAFKDARGDDPDAGMQYGNHVKVAHDDGTFTLYAHLDRVTTREGAQVASGEPLGTMGSTGLGGTRHLHFALLPTDAPGGGVLTTTAISSLLAYVSTPTPALRWLRGDDFEADPSLPWKGQLYGSENDRARQPDDAPGGALLERLSVNHASLRQATEDRLTLAIVAATWQQRQRAWVLGELAPILERDPENPVARYYLATAVQIPARLLDEAEQSLDRALPEARKPRRFEVWLEPWIHAQRSSVSLARGDEAQARARLQQAVERCRSRGVLQGILQHLGALRVPPPASSRPG